MVQPSEIGPLQAPRSRQRNQMRAIRVGQGCTKGETGPAQGAPLGSFGVASARSIFPSQASPHYCSYQGGGREGRSGAAWAPRTDLLGPQHQPTPTTIIIITVIIPRSLLRNAPHQRGVLRAVKAVPKHGSPQHKKKKEHQTPGWGPRAFASARLSVSQAHRNRSIALLLISKGAGAVSGWCIARK